MEKVNGPNAQNQRQIDRSSDGLEMTFNLATLGAAVEEAQGDAYSRAVPGPDQFMTFQDPARSSRLDGSAGADRENQNKEQSLKRNQ